MPGRVYRPGGTLTERDKNMKKKDIEIGEMYLVKVSGQLAPVRIVRESPYGGWDGLNMKTKREVRIRGAARLRRPYDQAAPMPFDLTLPDGRAIKVLRSSGRTYWRTLAFPFHWAKADAEFAAEIEKAEAAAIAKAPAVVEDKQTAGWIGVIRKGK